MIKLATRQNANLDMQRKTANAFQFLILDIRIRKNIKSELEKTKGYCRVYRYKLQQNVGDNCC